MRYLASLVSAAALVVGMLAVPVSAQAANESSAAMYGANDNLPVTNDSSGFGNLANGRKIYTQGKGDAVPACASCHGADGTGSDDLGTPRLADQVFTYELKQLDDFASGRRTDLTLQAMNDIAKGLTQQERRDVTTYVHSLKTKFVGSDLRALAAAGTKIGNRSRGRMIVEFGLDGLPACKSCHGFHGRSAGRIFPMIGGQRFVYLYNQLHYWRAKTRHNDPMEMMEKVAAKMTDQDILDLASFLTVAVPFTPGNPKQPDREEW